MLTQLKLMHARIGDLIEQAEGGGYIILEVSRSTLLDREAIAIRVARLMPAAEVKTCDRQFRRIASGEYECSKCRTITDDVENEQWQ